MLVGHENDDIISAHCIPVNPATYIVAGLMAKQGGRKFFGFSQVPLKQARGSIFTDSIKNAGGYIAESAIIPGSDVKLGME
jgi:hypothetical protein